VTVETIFALETIKDLSEKLGSLAAMRRREPFNSSAVDFVSEMSRLVLRSPIGRRFPELAALAHWFRPANLKAIEASTRNAAGDQFLRPRGMVFILAPANVDTLFIYGWFLSLLAGNATVVRVSQKPSESRDAFFELLREVATQPRFYSALADSWVVSYPHDDQVTSRFSSACDARLIWGGDGTVLKVRSIPMKPTAVEGGFADRFSIAALRAQSILTMDEPALAELVRRFVNDTLWFDQQACSSPRCIYWIGDQSEIDAARARFWPIYSDMAERFEDSPAAVMSRVSDLFMLAAEGAIETIASPPGARPSLGTGIKLNEKVRDLHSGFGLFVEYRVKSLTDIISSLTDKDQTLVVHGFEDNEVEELAFLLPNRSMDRIVPVGLATEFAVTWDGTNLLDLLIRRVSFPRNSGRF